MQHIDEHTLELYVLGEGTPERREAIERHLQECRGCRDLVDRMRTLYETAERLARDFPPAAATADHALARVGRPVQPWDDMFETVFVPVGGGALARFRRFLRVHPVLSAGGALALAAAGVLLANVVPSQQPGHLNPAYVSFNTGGGTVRIHAANDALVWEKPASTVLRTGFNTLEGRRSFAFQDLDGDGVREVITGCTFDDEGSDASTRLKIFDWRKRLVRIIPLDRPVPFPGRLYDPVLRPGAVCAADLLGPGSGGFLVLTSNVRSPSCILRFDRAMHEAGAYWHFGRFDLSVLTDFNHDGKLELLAGGMNDVEDSTGNLLPVLAVLDPARIYDDRRSSTSRGFSLPVSDAELWYVAFPWSDLDSLEGRQPWVQDITDAGNGSITVTLSNGQPGRIRYSFTYRFSAEMRLMEVRASTETERIYVMMRKAGRVSGNLDQEYVRRLRDRLRYWNGETWQNAAAPVAWDRTIVHAP